MILMDWKMFLVFLGCFVGWILIRGLEDGIRFGIFYLGIIYYGYSMVNAYIRLKNAHFIFKKAASKKEWIWFILSMIFTWALMCLVLSKEHLFYAVAVTHSILIMLLIIDRIQEWFRKI